MATQREASKQNWDSRNTVEDINSGSLQRIADATEKMAGNYIQLQHDRDLYKRWYEEQYATVKRLCKSNAALRGHIKRLKNLTHANQ